MSAISAEENRERVEAFTRKHRIALLTMLFTDVVGSTRLKQALGDRQAIELIQRHHALIRQFVARFPEAEEIETAGDSFFVVFAKPSDAAHCALLMQNGMRRLREETGHPVLDRVGIHVGEVFVQQHGETTRDLFGIQIDTAARVMSLGGADQILLSRFAFDSARQILRGFEIPEVGALTWLNHGYYEMEGVGDPVEVCEVGETGLAALAPPKDSEKAKRFRDPTDEPVRGWWPAVGETVPGTHWKLECTLGEGGFGEVWLARHEQLKHEQVIKFCLKAERARSLKREVTLFHVLRKRIGEHPNIVAIHEVFFDEPPFYIVMDYVDGPTFDRWAASHAAGDDKTLDAKLEILAQVADALQAAHDAGIIHRDVKPSNILVAEHQGASRAKLTDFGVGQVVNAEVLAGIGPLGFSESVLSSTAGASGTRIYMAPEVQAGQPATTRSDIYSLGVVLWQAVTANFKQPLTGDWPESVADPLLREDIQQCVAGDAQKRFAGAAQLAGRLRSLRQRRAAREEEAARIAALEARAYRRGMIRTATAAAVILIVIAGLAIYGFRQKNRAVRMLQEAARSDRQIALDHFAKNRPKLGLAHLARALDYDPRSSWAAEIAVARLNDWHLPLPLALCAGQNNVNEARFSPDGQRIVTASDDKTAQVWQATNFGHVVSLAGHIEKVKDAEFSPDGMRVVTASLDGTARIWDASSGKCLGILAGHDQGPLRRAQFSHGGELILTIEAGQVDTARVWETGPGQLLATLPVPISEAEFSPDDRRIVTVSSFKDTAAHVWDSRSGKSLAVLKGHNGGVNNAQFSPEGGQIVTASSDGTAQTWDASDGSPLVPFRGNDDRVRHCARFHPDGLRVITSGEDGGALWDASTGDLLQKFDGTEPSPNGERAISLGGDVSDTANGALSVQLRDSKKKSIITAHFSPDGSRVVTVSDNGESGGIARVWEAYSYPMRTSLRGSEETLTEASFSPDGRRVLALNALGEAAYVWDAGEGQLLATLKAREDTAQRDGSDSPGFRSAQFGPDGASVITVTSPDNTVRVWGIPGGELLVALPEDGNSVMTAEFSHDGKRIVTASKDKEIRVWDAGSGKQIAALSGHEGAVKTAKFSIDDKQIVSSSDDNTARVWESGRGKLLRVLPGHEGGVRGAQFSPDGQRIVTLSNWTRVWDAGSGQLLHKLEPADSAEFSSDGRRLLTTSHLDRGVRLGDSEGQLLGTLAHEGFVRSARFSPDGQRIVTTAGVNRAALVWDVASGRQIYTLVGHSGDLSDVEFSRDGQRIVTASHDATAQVWDILGTTAPPPRWFADFLRLIAQLKLNQDGEPVDFTVEEFLALRSRIQTTVNAESSRYAAIARWLLLPADQRPAHPDAK